MLSLVLPKGSLEKATFELFDAADLTIRRPSTRDYRASIDDTRIAHVRVLRSQEIPLYLEQGIFDLGVTTRDWIEENQADVVSVCELNYSMPAAKPARVVLAVPADAPWQRVCDLPDGVRISTEFPMLTQRYLEQQGVKAQVIPSYGATEAKAPDIVDAIVNSTAAESSMRSNGLRILETLLTSNTELVANRTAYEDEERRAAMEDIALLLRSVVQARGNVLLKLNALNRQLPTILEIMPAMSAPTITPLVGGEMHAVESVVAKHGLNRLIPLLESAGARDIIEIPITKIVQH